MTTNVDTQDSYAAFDAKEFFQKNGDSLSKLLHETLGNRGLDLFCECKYLLDNICPDPKKVGISIRKIFDLLQDAPMPGDQHADSLRWHGARLAELVAKL